MQDKITADLKQAMRDRNEIKKTTLQGVKSAAKYVEIENGQPLDDAQWLKLLMKEAKQRRESIALYKKGGNDAGAEKEAIELEIIESYLPDAPSDGELKQAVQAAIDETGASGMRDMGKVMSAVKAKLGDNVDGGQVAQIAKEHLA